MPMFRRHLSDIGDYVHWDAWPPQLRNPALFEEQLAQAVGAGTACRAR